MDGLFETRTSAELLQQFNCGAHGVKGRDLQDAGIVEASDTFILVFLQQGFEHGPGLLTVLGKDVAFSHVVGPLAPGERGLVESDVGR